MTATALPDSCPPHRTWHRLPAFRVCLALALAVGVAGGCGCKRDPTVLAPPANGEASATGKPLAHVTIGGRPFKLEIAATEADRNLGLMYRSSMADDAGMVFVFAQEKPLQFWMRNTRIPLDILYLDAAGKIVSVKQLKPFDETGVPSDGPAKYAVELNQGTAARVGVKAGDSVTFPPNVQKPADLE